MYTAFLYFVTVLAWGTSWFAIKFQFGIVPIELSVAYRCALASVILFVYCLIAKRRLRYGPAEHLFLALLGLLLFSFNYQLLYTSNTLMTSGLVAVAFSTFTVMNLINTSLFFRTRIDRREALAALIGLCGISMVFWPELRAFSFDGGGGLGLVLALCGTFLASLGNMTFMRNQRRGIPVIEANSWGMAYGALFIALFALARGESFVWDPSPGYALSLAWLVLPATVIAFWSYLTLVVRVGAGSAAYVAVLFPIVALGISTFLEGYEWTALGFCGVALVLAGNVIILAKRSKPIKAP